MHLRGWKSIANTLDYSVRTIKEWHYKRLKIPFKKTSQRKQAPIIIEKDALMNWFKEVLNY